MTGDDWRTAPRAVIEAYNQAVTAHGLPPQIAGAGRSKGSRGLLAAAERFGAWCVANKIDPYAYVLARHNAIGWRHRVPLSQLASASFLAGFLAWGGNRVAEEVSQARLANTVRDDTPRDGSRLIVMREQAKLRYAAARAWDVCAVSADFTGGYQASSPHCRRCPVAAGCKQGG